MADYTKDAIETFESIKADGGPITIIRPNTEAGPEPWEGNTSPPLLTAHFGLFYPTGGNAPTKGNSRTCLIPAYGIDFKISKDMRIKDQSGVVWKVNEAPALNLDGVTDIYFLCEVEAWPGR